MDGNTIALPFFVPVKAVDKLCCKQIMYTFTLKDNGADINVVVTRSLLALAGIASLLYYGHAYYYINILAAVLLFIAAFFVNRLLIQYKISTSLLLGIAAVIVLGATLFIPFAALLILYGLLAKKLYKVPTVNVNSEGVHITKVFGNTDYNWAEFNNIILKDNQLTLDFINNKLLQLSIADNSHTVDEYSFNIFCSGFIGI